MDRLYIIRIETQVLETVRYVGYWLFDEMVLINVVYTRNTSTKHWTFKRISVEEMRNLSVDDAKYVAETLIRIVKEIEKGGDDA